MAAKRQQSGQSLLSKVLKEYRKEHNLSQEKLAYELHVEPRTLRAWENEYEPSNVNELRRIAGLLGINPERLGIAASIYAPKTAKQIEEIVEHIWSIMHELRIKEAQIIVSRLLQDIKYQKETDSPDLLVAFAHAYHIAGYVASMSGSTLEVPQAIQYYNQMEAVARLIGDQTLLNTALAYQGDMYRRIGDLRKAITYLEGARDTTPQADAAAMGNAIQLLGRAYLPAGDIQGFEFALAEAEELGYQTDAQENSIHGHYNRGTVYEEYAKSYASLGQTQKALDYVDLAESTLPPTKNNKVLLMINRAEALVYGGDIKNGLPLAIEAATLSRMQGHYRRIERLTGMKRVLQKKSLEYGKAEIELSEALEGPMERWNMNV